MKKLFKELENDIPCEEKYQSGIKGEQINFQVIQHRWQINDKVGYCPDL